MNCPHVGTLLTSEKKPCGTLSPQQVLANISCHSISQTNSVKTGLKTSIGAMRRSILARLQAPLVRFNASALTETRQFKVTIVLGEEKRAHAGAQTDAHLGHGSG